MRLLYIGAGAVGLRPSRAFLSLESIPPITALLSGLDAASKKAKSLIRSIDFSLFCVTSLYVFLSKTPLFSANLNIKLLDLFMARAEES